MEKSHYGQEIDRLIIAAKELEEKEQIGYDTAIFLDQEAKKLEECIEDLNTTETERENVINKLNVLFGRIRSEIEHSSDNDDESLRIEKELLALTERGHCSE